MHDGIAERLKGIRWKVMYVCLRVLSILCWISVCGRLCMPEGAHPGLTMDKPDVGAEGEGLSKVMHAASLVLWIPQHLASSHSHSLPSPPPVHTGWCVWVCAALQHTRQPELHVHVRTCVHEWCLFSCCSWSWSIYWVAAHNQARRNGCVIEPFIKTRPWISKWKGLFPI